MKSTKLISKEAVLKERTKVRDSETYQRLASPLDQSVMRDRFIECEIEPRKYYPKSNQGQLVNKGSRSTTHVLTTASNHRNRQRAVITAGHKRKGGMMLNISNVESGSPKSMLHINQSLLDQIE